MGRPVQPPARLGWRQQAGKEPGLRPGTPPAGQWRMEGGQHLRVGPTAGTCARVSCRFKVRGRWRCGLSPVV
eukprot:3934656-Alexandrium_andersonii.AAC.1